MPLREAREALGVGLRAQARQADIDPSHYSKIERGEVLPTLPLLLKIAASLGLVEIVDAIRPLVEHR